MRLFASRISSSFCRIERSTVSIGSIYNAGPRASEPAYFLLVRRYAGQWYVANSALFSATPPWH